MTRLALVAVAAAISACGGGAGSGSNGDGGQVLTGTERFGWDQLAADRAELASFKYAMYVDGVRSEALDVTCASTRTSAGFTCTCRLPTLTPGPHTLQVAAFVVDGAVVRESSRSAPVRVTAR
jgi:hypothetical protein